MLVIVLGKRTLFNMVDVMKVCCLELDRRNQIKYTMKSPSTEWKEVTTYLEKKKEIPCGEVKPNKKKEGPDHISKVKGMPTALLTNFNSRRGFSMELRDCTRLAPYTMLKRCRFCATGTSSRIPTMKKKKSSTISSFIIEVKRYDEKSNQLIKEFACEFCHKKFTEKHQLDVHANIHVWRTQNLYTYSPKKKVLS